MLPSRYQLVDGPPSPADFVHLRRETELSVPTPDQAARGIDGAWAARHVVQVETGETVGMGRVLSDGACYFHVIDMAVLPAHQRQGIGDAVLTSLMDEIRAAAPEGATINLLADPPGVRLYERHGYVATEPREIGMVAPRFTRRGESSRG